MEVAIVGGGMAGAITGLWLQHHGVASRIYERKQEPGTTLCGEGLSARTLQFLAPVFDASPFIDTTFQGARWRFPGTEVQVHRECHTMARESWIPSMLDTFQERGGTVEFGTAARGDEGDVVIGADGPGSKLQARVGGPIKRRTGLQVRLETDADTDWLEFVTDKQFSREYAWWFPRQGVHNVGILAEQDGHDRARLDAFLEHLKLDGKVVKEEAYPIAFGGRRFVSDDGKTLLIGDAAGLTNPVTKGGIAAIVHAAPILAKAIAAGRPHDYQNALAKHPLTHPSYERALRRLRRWSNADLRRLLKPAPSTIHVAGPTTNPLPVAARTAMRPWRIPAMADFYQATVRSVNWSW